MKVQAVYRSRSVTRGALLLGGAGMVCAFGRGGIVAKKREGDGATPTGALPFRRVFFRPDRINRPTTRLPCHRLLPNLSWCDDPSSPRYNQLIKLPFSESHERLWRQDHLYDVLIELGHNDHPAIPFHGSAIFLHLCKNGYAPTQGCIAVEYRDMVRLLALVQPGDVVTV